MIAAMASEAREYVGYDPNLALQPCYRMIEKTFSSQVPEMSCRVHPRPFEEFQGPPYDLVFTSPPYYNLEMYSRDPGQSTETWPLWGDWKSRWYEPFLQQCWSAVRPGGFLALYVENFTYDQRIYPLEDITRTEMERLGAPSPHHLGLLVHAGSEGKKRPVVRWCHVWRKNESKDTH